MRESMMLKRTFRNSVWIWLEDREQDGTLHGEGDRHAEYV